jgi:hypothetical protein
MRLSVKPTIVAGESHKVFALWLSIRTIAQLASRGADLK